MSSSTADDNNVTRSGWVDKKSMRSMRKTGFVRRFMVLTNTRLYYLTSEPSTSFRDEIHFEVNLEIINEILNRDYHDKGLGKFDIVTPSRHLTIKCPFDEKLLWIRDIQMARDAILRTSLAGVPSLYNGVAPTAVPSSPGVGKKLKTLFRGVSGQEEGGGGGSETFTYEQARALSELHDFMCSSTDLCASIITAVFESLNVLNKQEKNKAARQLGQVLAMWLGESADSAENSRRASRLSVSHAGKPSQIDILTIWLEISLVREFKESCSFAPKVWTYASVAGPKTKGGGGGEGEGEGEGKTDSFSTGENKESEEEKEKETEETSSAAPNIPFRRDNVECLFILSFIKSVAQNTGMLSTWLMPSLLVISQNPDSFLPAQPTPLPPPPPRQASTSVEERVAGSLVAGGLAVMSSLRSLTMSSNSNAEDNFCRSTSTTSFPHDEAEEEDADDNYDYDSDEEDAVIVSRVFKLTPQDYFHLEAVKIINTMQRTEEFIPPSFKLLIATIFRLTVKTSDFNDRDVVPTRNISGDPGSSALQSPGGEGAPQEEVKSFNKYESQAEYGVYYASSCATLFLRLICPALLCPLEWGVLSQKNLMNFHPKIEKEHPPMPSSVTSDSGSNNTNANNKTSKRDRFKRFALGRMKSGHFSSSAEMNSCSTTAAAASAQQDQLDFVSDMNKNPAAAAIILVAHILNSCRLEEVWSSNDLDLDNFQQIQSNVVRLVPIEKLNAFVNVYETEQCQSIVDPSTRKTFESPPVRKGLMGLAKDIQRIANLSIASAHSMETQAEGVYSRLHSCHSDEPPSGEDFTKEVDFQVQQAKNIQALYNSLGETSKYVSVESGEE